jgi:hypothetical protein
MKRIPTWILVCTLLSACGTSGAYRAEFVDRLDSIPDTAVKITPADDPHPPQIHIASYSEPVPVPGPINTAGAEDSPFITPDGSVLYFFFSPAIVQPPEEELVGGIAGIYRSYQSAGGWSQPERVRLIQPDELALDGCPFFQDGVLWFCSARKGNFRGVDFWTARQEGDTFTDLRNAGELLNESYEIGEMHISPDGRDLLFHSNAPGGTGGVDLWVSHREGETWSTPVNLASLNTPGDEGWPFISSSGQELWFTRTYQGTPAVYRSNLTDGDWGPPELIVSQFAGEPTLDAAGNLYFVHHYLIDGELVEADLYIAYAR